MYLCIKNVKKAGFKIGNPRIEGKNTNSKVMIREGRKIAVHHLGIHYTVENRGSGFVVKPKKRLYL